MYIIYHIYNIYIYIYIYIYLTYTPFTAFTPPMAPWPHPLQPLQAPGRPRDLGRPKAVPLGHSEACHGPLPPKGSKRGLLCIIYNYILYYIVLYIILIIS